MVVVTHGEVSRLSAPEADAYFGVLVPASWFNIQRGEVKRYHLLLRRKACDYLDMLQAVLPMISRATDIRTHAPDGAQSTDGLKPPCTGRTLQSQLSLPKEANASQLYFCFYEQMKKRV